MKKLRVIVLLFAVVSLIAGLAIAPVFAEDSDSRAVSSSGSPAAPAVSSELKYTVETKNSVDAASMLEQMRKTYGVDSDPIRKQYCKTAKNSIETKIAALAKNTSAYEAKVDKALQLAEDYQKNKNITVVNWGTLLANAKAAQTQAAASEAALKALGMTVDCSQTTALAHVARIKVAATQARSDLQTYKHAVVALLVALKDAKTQGGNS